MAELNRRAALQTMAAAIGAAIGAAALPAIATKPLSGVDWASGPDWTAEVSCELMESCEACEDELLMQQSWTNADYVPVDFTIIELQLMLRRFNEDLLAQMGIPSHILRGEF